MSAVDILSLLHIIILAVGVILTMLLIGFKRDHKLTFLLTLLTLSLSLITIFIFPKDPVHNIGELFIADRFGLYFQTLILSGAIIVTLFSYSNINSYFSERRKEEYYLLLMLATLGSAMIVMSTHFISFFVSLEILSISLYSLIGYYRQRLMAIEASLKYLVLAAMSSSFLLFGMGLIYAISGTMAFQNLATIQIESDTATKIILVAGIAMMIVGIGFKLALVPFHMWTPDVYEGASSPVAAFIATVSKGSMVALLLRFFMLADLYRIDNIVLAFTIISILSMLIGNLLALLQNNIKRVLAYSSISHFGYLLVAVLAGREIGPQAATFYITIYMVTLLTAFGLIAIISKSDVEAVDVTAYRGLFWRRPILATIFTIVLLSLAGIPLTAGFIGKYFLLNAGVANAKWMLVSSLVVSSVIGLYYYLRLIVSMMSDMETQSENNLQPNYPAYLILSVLGIFLIAVGVWPTWLMNVIDGIFR